jgi:hypothetical protein
MLLHRLALCSYIAPSGCTVLHAIIFVGPMHRRPRLSLRRLPWCGSPRPCKVFVKLLILPCLLRVPPLHLYRLHAWPLIAIIVPTTYTIVFVHYDFTASVIALSSTSLLLQPPMALAPLHCSPSRNSSGALSASPSTWHEVHVGPALRMLGAGNTATCFRPRRVPVSGKLGSALRLHRP